MLEVVPSICYEELERTIRVHNPHDD